MNHANFFPFERNRYFYGKLLTVRDFEVEQRYHCPSGRCSTAWSTAPAWCAAWG